MSVEAPELIINAHEQRLGTIVEATSYDLAFLLADSFEMQKGDLIDHLAVVKDRIGTVLEKTDIAVAEELASGAEVAIESSDAAAKLLLDLFDNKSTILGVINSARSLTDEQNELVRIGLDDAVQLVVDQSGTVEVGHDLIRACASSSSVDAMSVAYDSRVFSEINSIESVQERIEFARRFGKNSPALLRALDYDVYQEALTLEDPEQAIKFILSNSSERAAAKQMLSDYDHSLWDRAFNAPTAEEALKTINLASNKKVRAAMRTAYDGKLREMVLASSDPMGALEEIDTYCYDTDYKNSLRVDLVESWSHSPEMQAKYVDQIRDKALAVTDPVEALNLLDTFSVDEASMDSLRESVVDSWLPTYLDQLSDLETEYQEALQAKSEFMQKGIINKVKRLFKSKERDAIEDHVQDTKEYVKLQANAIARLSSYLPTAKK